MGSDLQAEHDRRTVYSVGDCPVCSDSGAVIVLRRLDTPRSVFLCPLCGVAWNEPPPRQLDEIVSLDTLAPNGVTLPTNEEVGATGLAIVGLSFDRWYPLLKPFLERH
jgi:hypothetical protein